MVLVEKGFFKRNKKILILALLILIISMIVGAGLGYIKTEGYHNAFSNMIASGNVTNNTNSDLGLNTFDLFVHNFTVDLLTIVFGLLFSVISVIITVINGLSIAFPFGFDFKFAAAGILPHGIFEYTASFLALWIAFILTKLEITVIKNRNFKNTLKDNRAELKDALILFIIMVLLLLVAAFVEANITEIVMNWSYGL